MILKPLSELKHGDFIAKNIVNKDSILFKEGKEVTDDIISKLKSLNVKYVYVAGEPEKKDIIKQYFIELENKFETDVKDCEKIEYLMGEKEKPEKLTAFFNLIEDVEKKKRFIDYCFNYFSDEIFNFFLKAIRMGESAIISLYIIDLLDKKIREVNIESVVSLYNSTNAQLADKITRLLKKNFTLRQLYMLKKRLEEKNETYDFFNKDINFSIMPPKYFWDVKILIVSTEPSQHILLKGFLESLEMNVKSIDFEDIDVQIDSFNPHLVLVDLDNYPNSASIFTGISNKYQDKIYLVLSSSVNKELLAEVSRAGATYFIKKPYSLPKIQNYLSTAVKDGKVIKQLSTSNNLLTVYIKNLGNKIKKFDFSGELTGFTIDEIGKELVYYIKNDKYYFFDMQNIAKVDMSGIRFFMKLKEDINSKLSELFIINCCDNLKKEFGTYSNVLNFAESWEEQLW
ncbi:MAG: STAS domain-containing protein [Candidatus Muiribacteriota bacterium]